MIYWQEIRDKMWMELHQVELFNATLRYPFEVGSAFIIGLKNIKLSEFDTADNTEPGMGDVKG